MRPSRRDLARLLGLGSLGLAVPGVPSADASSVSALDRRFLFIFAKGGWDPVFALAPMFGSPYIALDERSVRAEANGIPFVDSMERPSVRQFFETWGASTCMVHGMEVRAVTHDQCRRLIMTGTNDVAADDWASTLAAPATELLLPSLVLSGPSFTTQHARSVVRVGENGQLAALLDGTATPGVMPREVSSLVDAHLRQRVTRFGQGQHGSAAVVADDIGAALDRLDSVRALESGIDLSVSEPDNAYLPVSARTMPALRCLSQGLSRVAMVEHPGLLGKNWDSHSDGYMQSAHFEILFSDLNAILAEMAGMSGPLGGSLLSETCVVVFSEMGRAPQWNAMNGKDHWTFTTAMMIGSGISGGRVVGGYDPGLLGLRTDLDSGEVSDGGERLTSQHFGATLFALGGVDPGEVPPIGAVLAGGV